MKSLLSLFPNASESTVKANPEIIGDMGNDLKLGRGPTVKSRGKMNKTEAEFAMKLEVMLRNGEIARYEFEGITLRFAGVKYTPDFMVTNYDSNANASIKFIEVKGAFTKGKYERAVERFWHARTYWKEFTFELHQKTKQGWKQITR